MKLLGNGEVNHLTIIVTNILIRFSLLISSSWHFVEV